MSFCLYSYWYLFNHSQQKRKKKENLSYQSKTEYIFLATQKINSYPINQQGVYLPTFFSEDREKK